MDHADVFADFSWNDPALALDERWLAGGSEGGDRIASVDIGDLVSQQRDLSAEHDVGRLARRTMIIVRDHRRLEIGGRT